MKEINKYKNIWEEIVEDLYTVNEDFNYIVVKKIIKRIKTYKIKIDKKIIEINTTLSLTDFNSQVQIREELLELLDYLNEMSSYLEQFIILEPTTKKGYYNYLKNTLALL